MARKDRRSRSAKRVEALGNELEIFGFTELQEKRKFTNALRSAGLSRAALEMDKKLAITEKKMLNALADEAKRAIRLRIPVDSGELRDDHIYVRKAKVANLDVSVGIDSETHTQYGANDPVEASGLANWLDDLQPGPRSKPTKRPAFNWIKDCQNIFKGRYRQALAKVLNA